MNSAIQASTARAFTLNHADGLCCPERGYRGDLVYAIVRVSHSTRYVFADGRTLTTAPKTRYATFPRPDSPANAMNEAMEELQTKHPLTRNLWVTLNDRAVRS